MTALKAFKRNFSDAFTVAYTKTKSLFDKLQIKHNDRVSLHDFQQNLECHITWLRYLNYDSIPRLPECLTKVVRSLPNNLSFIKP